jgi:hypothetical protein
MADARDARIATAADYADAMMTARRAKHWCFLLLLLMLIVQLAAFFVAKFTNAILTDTPRAVVTTAPVAIPPPTPFIHGVMNYLISGIDFLGVAIAILLSIVLLLIVNIMLVGRLIGVARVTSAYIWSVLLALLLFPWQAFLEPYAFKIPGVLYTWEEFSRDAHFSDLTTDKLILRWARFFVFPLIAVIILFMIQIKSNRGLKQALGESLVATRGAGTGAPEPSITM